VLMSGGELGDLIFLADPENFATLRDAEFRDRTVVKFDADKVKDVNVTTYSGATKLKGLFTLKDKTWILAEKSSEITDFTPDKVDALVRFLSNLKAERYVAFKADKAK